MLEWTICPYLSRQPAPTSSIAASTYCPIAAVEENAMSQSAPEANLRPSSVEATSRLGAHPGAGADEQTSFIARVATIFARSPLAVQIYDRTGTLAWMNEAHRTLYGLPDVGYGVGSFNPLSDPRARAEGRADQYALALSGEVVQLTLSVGRPTEQGPRRSLTAQSQVLEQSLLPLYDPTGAVAALLVFTGSGATAQSVQTDVARLHRSMERRAQARKADPEPLLARLQLEAAAHQRTLALIEARELQELQRIESLGLLARGMAHDLNNLLTRIQGNADLALLSVDDHTPELARAYLNQICTAVGQAARLTSHILSYTGRGQPVTELIDLNELISSVSDLLQTLGRYQCQLHPELAPGLPLIRAEAVQVRQIILNLVLNAAEAIGDNPGTVTITTARATLGRAELAELTLGTSAEPGPFVRLTIADTGCGMDAASLARIFEPFFTTRLLGRGLGLTAVHGIVREHRGALRVTSMLGLGTTFEIWLPAVEGA
jgi:signal transduction histidine kinase